jgi:diadenosine tetraphosphate (Ap4A) HIT family hydrolase
MPEPASCVSCTNNARSDLPPRERVYVGPRWRAAHAFDCAVPGWLVLLPMRHVTALDELTADEAADLGPLLRALTAALRKVTGCQKTYVALFAEADGFAHVHFHVIPRDPGLPAEFRGPRVFGMLTAEPGRRVPVDAMDQIAAEVGGALRLPGSR